jgi:hypothetical protein
MSLDSFLAMISNDLKCDPRQESVVFHPEEKGVGFDGRPEYHDGNPVGSSEGWVH